MILNGYVVTDFATNCYMIGCEETKQIAVIDPGGSAAELLEQIQEAGWQVQYIINTHGHMDHIGGNGEIKNKTQAEILIHEADANLLTNPRSNLSLYFQDDLVGTSPDRLLKDGDRIQIGNTVELEVIHTPGHTPGGISLKIDNMIFVGDTLFRDSIGRTDFPGGSYEQIIKSIRERLFVFPDEVVCYTGHGPATTVGYERLNNPFAGQRA